MSPVSRRLTGFHTSEEAHAALSHEAAEGALDTLQHTEHHASELRPVTPSDQQSWTAAKEENRQPREAWSAPNRSWDKPFVEVVETPTSDVLITQAIRRGLPLDEAVATSVREATGINAAEWRALCHSLAEQPATRSAGMVGSALLAQRSGLRDLAWDLLSALDVADAARLAPAEYLRAGIAARDPRAVPVAARWLETGAVGDPAVLLELARLFFVADEHDLAQAAVDAARKAPGLGDVTETSLDYLEPWIRKAAYPAPAPRIPTGHVSFAVIDYKAPDEVVSSSNIGDNVQTVASLGHLVRHEGVRLHGDPEVTEPVSFLAGRVRPELKITGPGADVHLTVVQRDVTYLDSVPENTWMLAFGWYMHNQFDLRFGFPFHENLNPVFVSFHLNKYAVLTPTAVDYLKAHGPIGCRDWTTVHLLLNAGVPAFFSGCLTTTVSTVFPAEHAPAPSGAPRVYVDTAAPSIDDAVVTHSYPEVRSASFSRNLYDAVALLDSYRTDYSKVVTSRLHCFLPAWAIGANVDFTPKNDADIRFAGLLDATEEDRLAMQARIRDLVAAVMGRILAGASRDEVYGLWQETTVALVEHARRVHAEPVPAPVASFDVHAAVESVRATRVLVEATRPRPGEPVNVAVALDGNLRSQMEVVVGGVVRHTDRPVRVVALTREHGTADHARLTALFPEVTFEWYACDDVDYGSVLGMLKHITVATMDRLLLPELLPHLDKVLYHDLDALAVTDLTPLYDVDLGEAPLLARPSISYNYRHGIGNVIRSTRLLRHDPAAARDLVRSTAQRHRHGFRGFNAGILLLNLAVMRGDGFTAEFVPYAERYGLNDQDILNAYAGSRYLVMDDRWNAWPTQEVVTEPALVHWAGPVKPWSTENYIHLRQHWQDAEGFVAERRATR
ncbi:glycosyltransferase [Antribacter gilvus]|uniref:glycosyltransferase n=1 Tax=Antribacter gilvus TaxID=2304675 RepID=UPI000F7B35D3|nr:glycosyltransferase [Antribacter gilvus]